MEKFERIEAYLTGSMSPSEKEEFKLMLTNDPSLRQEVDKHAKMLYSLDKILEDDVRNHLHQLSAGSTGDRNPMVSKWKGRWMALIFLIALTILLFYIQFFKSLSPEGAFIKYYNAPMAENIRGGEELFEDPVAVDYFQAHSLIAKEDFSGAYKVLEKLNLPESNKWHDNVEWYKSLLLLKLEPEKGHIEIKRLLDSENHKYQENIELLAKDLGIR